MPLTRRHRIVRRAVMALVVVVLLPIGYVGVWLAISRAEHDGHIGRATVQGIRPAFVPLVRYCESELPGSDVLGEMWWLVNPPKIETGKSGALTFKYVTTPQLAPPTTARVDEILKAEFPKRNW